MQFYLQANIYLYIVSVSLIINYKLKRTLYQEFLDISLLEMTSNSIHF